MNKNFQRYLLTKIMKIAAIKILLYSDSYQVAFNRIIYFISPISFLIAKLRFRNGIPKSEFTDKIGTGGNQMFSLDCLNAT